MWTPLHHAKRRGQEHRPVHPAQVVRCAFICNAIHDFSEPRKSCSLDFLAHIAASPCSRVCWPSTDLAVVFTRSSWTSRLITAKDHASVQASGGLLPFRLLSRCFYIRAAMPPCRSQLASSTPCLACTPRRTSHSHCLASCDSRYVGRIALHAERFDK